MSKGKNKQETSDSDSALGPGVQAPDFKLRSTRSLPILEPKAFSKRWKSSI